MKTFGLLFGREVAVVAVRRLREGGLSWEERVGQKQVLKTPQEAIVLSLKIEW